MRVLQMGAYPPPHGGVQTNVVAIRQHLLENDVPCDVINLTRHRESRAPGLHHPTTPLQVVRLLRKLSYDIVHMHHGGELTPRLLALYAICSSWPRKKTVLTCHSGGYGASSERAHRWSPAACVFRRIDRIVAVNSQLASMFARMGVEQTRIRQILPFAIRAPDPQRQLPSALSEFFARHNPRLVSVGSLLPEYDVPLQVNLMQHVLEQFPRAGLAVIGSGRLHTEISDMIRSRPYGDHILLCRDVEHEDTLCAIREADMLLRTTLYDGDAISIREALYLGTPVVASDNRMRPEGVHLFPARDLDCLCDTVLGLLNHPQERLSRGASGLQNVQAILDLYRELVV